MRLAAWHLTSCRRHHPGVGQRPTLLSLQELLTRAHNTDTGPETTRMRMLLCVEEAKLFEAGRHSIKAVEAWR